MHKENERRSKEVQNKLLNQEYMSKISEWETGVDEEGGYWIEPETGMKWRWKGPMVGRGQVFTKDSNAEEQYDPYCTKCGACGESGCCSPTMCTQDGGDYCQRYLNDLHHGYLMHQFFSNTILEQLTQEQREAYDKEWDRQYDRIYKNKE